MPSSTYPAKPEQSTHGKTLYQKSGESQPRQDILSQKIKFQSQDSEGSNISYQSSLQSDDQMQLNRIDYFKQEMARFFINYPELVNEDLIARDVEQESYQEQEKNDVQENIIGNKRQKNTPGNQKNINHSPIALEVLKQAKDSLTSLQSLAKRITIYKSKTQQPDLIDIIIKQQSSILKEIDLDLNLRKFQNTDQHLNINSAEGVSCQNQNIVAGSAVGDTVYYSWKKKREIETKKRYSNHIQGKDHSKRKDSFNDNRQKEQRSHVSVGLKISYSKTQQKFHSLSKNLTRTQHSRNPNINTNRNTLENKPQKHPGDMKKQKKGQQSQQGHDERDQAKKSQDLNNNQLVLTKSHDPNSKLASSSNASSFALNNTLGTVNNLRDLYQHKAATTSSFPNSLVFQPKTQVGKQLLQQIKKFNATDELNIKKTIINFVSKHRQSLEKDNVNKNTLSQKINKQFSQDSKELVMYYPGKQADSTMQISSNAFHQVNQHNKQNTGGEIINPIGTHDNNHITSDKDGKSNPQFNSSKNVTYGNNSNGFMNSNGTMSANYNTNGTFNKNGIKNISGNSTQNEGTILPTETDSLLEVLKQISEGPLMKYWKMLQEKKL